MNEPLNMGTYTLPEGLGYNVDTLCSPVQQLPGNRLMNYLLRMRPDIPSDVLRDNGGTLGPTAARLMIRGGIKLVICENGELPFPDELDAILDTTSKLTYGGVPLDMALNLALTPPTRYLYNAAKEEILFGGDYQYLLP